MRRWRERLEKDGYSGLTDRRKGKASAHRVPLATAAQGDEIAKKARDAPETDMTPAQIAEAQKLSREWKPKKP
jgi:hypothetical protein